MTDLTVLSEKGILPGGWYYLKVNEELANHPVIAECVIDYALELPFSYFYDFDEAKIEQVLEPVPSHEEWKAKLEENTKLKELLKEVLRHELSLKEVSELTRKIGQALGE